MYVVEVAILVTSGIFQCGALGLILFIIYYIQILKWSPDEADESVSFLYYNYGEYGN